jgi:3-dehydroquinate synthase
MEHIELPLADNAYTISIGRELLDQRGLLDEHIAGNSVFIVTNETVAPLYLDKLQSALQNYRVSTHILPDGEAYKNLTSYEAIMKDLLAGRQNRSTTMIALGGGVVGDIAGFAAATYQRGVDFIQVPTTLLAQVDSSVGGKTAVNHALGKNMIGAFYQPRAVYIDTQTLTTLPDRELSAGLAEVIKHGALADADYFSWIEQNMNGLLAIEPDVMATAIRKSCEIKASIVAEDEKEQGRRALLNLGHTFGHAIEQLMGYGNWLHGEAVGTGLVMAADLSYRLKRIPLESAQRVKQLVSAAGLPVAPPEHLSVDDYLDSMAVDKKATDQGVRFILLNALGDAELVSNVDTGALCETLQAGEQLATRL